MKTIIKNLMLVAVAAMAFVACSQEGNEVNILAKKTTYEFVASFDAETRSQFVEDTDGDKVFQSVWNGGEEVLLFADAGSSVYADGTATMVLPEGGDGTTATFTGEFNGTVPSAGTIKAYVPASAWNVWSEAITIPATQTPTDHSVDSAAHILFGQTDYTDNTAIDGSDIMFSHAVAYGKMTIADAFESIDEVTITIDETEKYTINTNELTSSTIWFACYANENVNNLEVLVKSGDKTYVRTYNLSDGKLAFKTGRVSIFSVSNFEEYVAPSYTFVSAAYTGDVYGAKQITFTAADGTVVTYGFTDLLGNYFEEKFYNYEHAADFSNDYRGQVSMNGTNWPGFDMAWAIPTMDVKIVDGVYNISLKCTHDTQVAEGTYVGDITNFEYPAAAPTEDTAVAVLVEDTTFNGFNPYDVTFNFTTGEEVKLRFNTGGKNYIPVGEWQSDNWQAANYISDVKLTGGNPALSKCVVSYADDKYTVEITMYDWDNSKSVEVTYVGAIEGLVAPEETTGGEGGDDNTGEGGEDSGDDTPSTGEADGLTIATAYTFTSYTTYKDGGYPVMCLSGAENGAEFNLESNGMTSYPTGLVKVNSGPWYTVLCEYKIHDVLQSLDMEASATYLVEEDGGYTVEYIYLVTEDGNGLYYKYDGVMTI